MNNIVLKNKEGIEETYYNVEVIKFKNADGEFENYTPQPQGTLTITENGVKNVSQYSEVDVNVPNELPEGYIKPEGTKEIIKNGTYDVVEYAKVTVNVPGVVEPLLQEKTVNENGEVTPDEGFDGLSKVIVSVPILNYTNAEGVMF